MAGPFTALRRCDPGVLLHSSKIPPPLTIAVDPGRIAGDSVPMFIDHIRIFGKAGDGGVVRDRRVRALSQHPAPSEHEHAIHRVEQRTRVRHDHQGPRRRAVEQHRRDLAPGLGFDRREAIVDEQEARSRDDRPRDQEAHPQR